MMPTFQPRKNYKAYYKAKWKHEEIERTSEPESEMAGMLKWSDQQCFLKLINMMMVLTGKSDNM